MDVSVGAATMFCSSCTKKRRAHNFAPIPPPWESTGLNLLIHARTHPDDERAQTILASFNNQLLQTKCFKVSTTKKIVHDKVKIQEIINELTWFHTRGIDALIDAIHFGLRGVLRTDDTSHYCTVNDEMMNIINSLSL
jgi:hypothetical protein